MPPEFGTTSMRMRASSLVLLGSAACLALAAGAMPAAYGRDPAAPYLGMTKEQIIACAGEPHSTYQSGDAETLVYHYSGDGPVPAPPESADEKKKKKDKDKGGLSSFFGDKKGKKKDKDWTCSASLVFENGRLARVNFAHKDVRSPYQWQSEKDPKKREALKNTPVPTCNFSLPRCAQQ
jgi:hypothetical protein